MTAGGCDDQCAQNIDDVAQEMYQRLRKSLGDASIGDLDCRDLAIS